MLATAYAREPASRVGDLPPPADWKQHFQRDIAPFWETPMALGNPIGNFPTFRCNDGSLYDPQSPCPELASAPDWIHSALGRQYVRMLSRQIYFYGVAFHLTGDQKYLVWAHAGVGYLIDHAFDPGTGNIVSYWQGGQAVAEGSDRTSQDLAYTLVGLSFYYYLTRDPDVLPPILRAAQYIRQHYYDPRLGLYRLALQGPEADHLDLVAELDQVNAYMVLTTPLLPVPYQSEWRTELGHLAQIMRDRFYDRGSGFFLGRLNAPDNKSTCIFGRVDTDFGHTIKTYWMLFFAGRILQDASLEHFARKGAPGILRHAFLRNPGSWATQPTCGGKSGGMNRTSTWWIAAELDQAALTFGLADPQLLQYVPKTYDFWLKHMVDRRFGEVWDEVAVPDLKPQLPKVHLWKNGFHTAEHALVGYILSSAVRSEPLTLYYAFPGCKIPAGVQPYYYEGTATSHAESQLPDVPGLCRVAMTFAQVH